ncbi:hypothetical protein PL263_10700 [Methylomonas sp. EFPC3]|uniref:hypothetical protein n=1 Tax=Methylomonas sp. EFPC3 TaxID=3021710 RepID=UPI002416F6EE|nr:hypothetical protein [Methylomonas sp. EFPC3]WFP48582.1 hypothetical protein PL263_10700 [Methylomonas sp. EFPC3]
MTLFTKISFAVSLFALSTQLSLAAPLNGDFSSNLDSWVTSGPVGSVAQAAQLTDNQGGDSSLFQGVALASGQYTLEFDALNLLSRDIPNGNFPDAFFASLYFANDLNQFDLANGIFDNALALFDLDYSGVANNNGAISASALGGDWFHFSILFNNSYGFAIPTFELFNLNATDGDSQVLIDNVVISSAPTSTVPEPASLLLWLIGLPAYRFSRSRLEKA